MEAVQELLQQIPGSIEMMTIPGVSLVTVAGFLAEVGDLKGYEHRQQIIKLAGLNLEENSSGKQGTNTNQQTGASPSSGLVV